MNRRQRRANARSSKATTDRAERFLQTGFNYEQAGDLVQAEAYFRKTLTIQPNHADALHLLGVVALKAGQHSAAFELIRLAIQHNRQNAVYRSNLGVALSYQGNHDEAIAAYREAIRINPGFAEAHTNLGNSLRELGKFEEAVAACRESIRIRPDSAETYANLGAALCGQGKFDEAVAALQQSIKLKPNLAEAHSNLGIALRDQGKLDEAIAAFRQAIVIRPDLADAYSNLGITLRDQGKPSEAVAACRQAIHIRPNFADAYANLGAAVHDLGKLDEAVVICRQAIALNPNAAEAHNNLAISLIELGQLPEGRAAFEKAIRLAPRNARYLRNIGDIVRYTAEEDRLAELERLAEASHSLSMDNKIHLHFALGKAYDDVGRHAEAFRHWLSGNALQRDRIAYDEAAVLGALDRAQRVFTPELIRSRQNVGLTSSVPTFIIGMPRSGTTLIEQILASHPYVFGGGELMDFQETLVEIRMTLGDGSATYPEFVSNMREQDYFDLGERYLSRIQRISAAPRITDKMPLNFMFAGLIHLALPDARLIHAVRDPADTCLSCFSKLFAGEQNHTYDLAELGRYYRHYRALMAHWYRVLPAGRILNICYEDVVADIEGQARRIIAHCGLDWDPRCLAFHETKRPVRTASAVQVREPIYSSAVGRWHSYREFLEPLLAELGERDG